MDDIIIYVKTPLSSKGEVLNIFLLKKKKGKEKTMYMYVYMYIQLTTS